ncbi:hypothetical protein J6590_077958 [Homalodisca vitripennis]|nr:hypothetical protein J6590_077958 [Homalodisca vitripennis]
MRSVTIEGDNHARDLISLVQQRVSRTTAVTGFCKPWTKLLAVTSGRHRHQGAAMSCWATPMTQLPESPKTPCGTLSSASPPASVRPNLF